MCSTAEAFHRSDDSEDDWSRLEMKHSQSRLWGQSRMLDNLAKRLLEHISVSNPRFSLSVISLSSLAVHSFSSYRLGRHWRHSLVRHKPPLSTQVIQLTAVHSLVQIGTLSLTSSGSKLRPKLTESLQQAQNAPPKASRPNLSLRRSRLVSLSSGRASNQAPHSETPRTTRRAISSIEDAALTHLGPKFSASLSTPPYNRHPQSLRHANPPSPNPTRTMPRLYQHEDRSTIFHRRPSNSMLMA